jgi:type I restriction enzyme S subunit
MRFSFNRFQFDEIPLLIPPTSEQKQIVSFLDDKTEKIDELIEKTKQKIELLKEKRTSLINHCVTKGLNPNVDMKDSGVEWIGKIPSHWDTIPLRFLGNFQNGISKGSEYFGSGFPFMNYGDVYKNEITPTELKGKVQSTEIDRNRYSVLRGDIFFTRTSESKDDIGVSSVCLQTIPESVFSGFLIRFRYFQEKHIPEYSRYHFQTHWKKVFIESKMDIVTRSSLSQQVLGQLPVLIVSIEEQHLIVQYLNEQTEKIDSTIEKETQRIELLKEYRQSLISEVVTGKIDVREWKQ